VTASAAKAIAKIFSTSVSQIECSWIEFNRIIS